MSAFIVTENHINYILTVYKKALHGEGPNLHEIGQELWTENMISVQNRYRGNVEGYYLPFFFRPFEGETNIVTALKQIACLRYQSCEHNGWQGSEARTLCGHIENILVQALPGWSEAPWGIE